jgi:SAM-dependent methyltransferase
MSPFPKAAQFYPTKDQFKDDAGITLDVFQCSACSLVQLSIEPVEYYKEVITAASLSPKAKAARLTEIETFLQTYHLKGKRALEIGCARGDMLDVIDEAGLYPTGLEFSPSSVDIGRKRGRTIHCDYINTYNPNEKADVFFSFNYMEHQPSPKDFIQSIHRVTSNDAMGYITVPNLSYLLDSKCLYEFVADHLVYFTPQTLRLAFENNGFDVLNCELINNNNDILAIVKKRTPLHIHDHIAEVDQLKSELNKLVNQYADHGKKIAVWGAGHRTLALLAISQINKIAFIVDSADFKQGKYSPIMFSKIVSPQTLEESDVDSIIIMVPGIYPDEVLKTVQGFARKLDVYMLKGNSIIRAQ